MQITQKILGLNPYLLIELTNIEDDGAFTISAEASEGLGNIGTMSGLKELLEDFVSIVDSQSAAHED